MGRFKKDFSDIYKGLGLTNAVIMALLPRILGRIKPDFNLAKYEWEVYSPFIKHKFGNIVSAYKEVPIKQEPIPNVIWVFWWQGEKAMPPIIRFCYNSVIRNANGRRVILLDENNYNKYVTLPNYILNKFKLHKISFPHFSDILRMALLKKFGGMWIDAAIFVTKPIPKYVGSFFSPRLTSELQESPHMSQWVIGVMGGAPQMPLFSFMYDMLTRYWEMYDGPFHYLMFDYFLRYGYNNIPWLKEMISKRPISSPNLHWTRYNFAKEANKEVLNRILTNNTYLSLTYRFEYPRFSPTGKETYYTALLKRYNLYDNESIKGGGG